jgi:hypothetical protein
MSGGSPASEARPKAGQTPRLKGMSKVEEVEQGVEALSPEVLVQFRVWFLEYDWATWDRQAEHDVRAGKLDGVAERVLRDHAAGKITLP